MTLLPQRRRAATAAELAVELGVSERTVYRDVAALTDAGVPLWTEPGRGGGIRLVDGRRTRLDGLTAQEAAALFTVGAPQVLAELGMGTALAGAHAKLLATLPEGLRDHARSVAERFHLDAPAGWVVPAAPRSWRGSSGGIRSPAGRRGRRRPVHWWGRGSAMAVDVGGARRADAVASWIRVVGTGLIGAVAAPMLAMLAFAGLWALGVNGGSVLPLLGALGAVAVVAVVALAGLESATSAAPTGWAGRLSRAVVVLVVGSVGWLAGAWVNLTIGSPLDFPGMASLVLGGLPFALVAAMFRGGRWAAGAVVTTLVAAACLGALVAAGPRLRADAAVAERFAADRDLHYELEIPGYGPGTRNDIGRMMWLDTADPGLIDAGFWDRRVYLTTSRTTFDCASAVLDLPLGRDDRPTCTQEEPDLWLLTGTIPPVSGDGLATYRQYVRQDGGTVIAVTATDAVPQTILRAAVLDARRATDDDLRRLVGHDG